MHNGVIPGTFSANAVSSMPTLKRSRDDDMKSENKKNGAGRKSFIQWLQYRARAEEEERDPDDELDYDEDDGRDWKNDDFEDIEYDEFDDEDDGDDDIEGDDEPEEFDDYDEEKELHFDDDETDSIIGKFSDFYRMDDDDYEEEQETMAGGMQPSQPMGGGRQSAKDRAQVLFQQLVNRQDMGREEIIQEFQNQLGITEETAITYYEDLVREFDSGQQGEMQPEVGGGDDDDDEGPVDELPGDTEMQLSHEEIDAQDPNAQGIIRTVPNAHLVYKRQMEDGSFEELWIYNLGDELDDALNIRREILNGTDIPRGHTRSENGQQSYTLQTMGNAQLLHVLGLSN